MVRWLQAIPFVVLLAWAECAPGCSSSDSTNVGDVSDASQPGPTRFEAGSVCGSSADCEPGLLCLFPAATCNTEAVCVAAPWYSEAGACDQPQSACSCLREIIEVCHGYAQNPVDTTTTCEGGTSVIGLDAGPDATVSSTDAGPGDAAGGQDASSPDAGLIVDASDAGHD